MRAPIRALTAIGRRLMSALGTVAMAAPPVRPRERTVTLPDIKGELTTVAFSHIAPMVSRSKYQPHQGERERNRRMLNPALHPDSMGWDRMTGPGSNYHPIARDAELQRDVRLGWL